MTQDNKIISSNTAIEIIERMNVLFERISSKLEAAAKIEISGKPASVIRTHRHIYQKLLIATVIRRNRFLLQNIKSGTDLVVAFGTMRGHLDVYAKLAFLQDPKHDQNKMLATILWHHLNIHALLRKDAILKDQAVINLYKDLSTLPASVKAKFPTPKELVDTTKAALAGDRVAINKISNWQRNFSFGATVKLLATYWPSDKPLVPKELIIELFNVLSEQVHVNPMLEAFDIEAREKFQILAYLMLINAKTLQLLIKPVPSAKADVDSIIETLKDFQPKFTDLWALHMGL